MEYIPGQDLFEEMSNTTGFCLPAYLVRAYAAHLVSALGYLHEICAAPNCIVHRDIKPENILVDARTSVLRLADFGFARSLSSVAGRAFSIVGTPEYMAPEVVAGREFNKAQRAQIAYRYGHGRSVDWWGLGIVIYEMLAGCTPFYEPGGHLEIWRKMGVGIIRFGAEFDQPAAGCEAMSLIRQLLKHDENQRLGNLHGGARDVESHAWFQGIDFTVAPPRCTHSTAVNRK